MSAFVHDQAHIRMLVNAGLRLRGSGPLRWGDRPLTEDEVQTAYRSGLPWGPGAAQVARARIRDLTPDTAGMVGAMLWAQNQRSVNFRYNEDDIEPPYQHGQDARQYSPLQVLMGIDSYEYQSCEAPGWEASEARRFCDALRHAAICALPGYDEADTWRVEDPAEPAAAAAATPAGDSLSPAPDLF